MDEKMHINVGWDYTQLYHSLLHPDLNCWWAALGVNSCPLALPIQVWLTTEISHTSIKAEETWIINPHRKHSYFSLVFYYYYYYKSNVFTEKTWQVQKYKKGPKKFSQNLSIQDTVCFKCLVNMCGILADFLPIFQLEIPLSWTNNPHI